MRQGILLLLLALFASPSWAQKDDDKPDVVVEATVDTSELERSGRFTIKLKYTVKKMVDRPFRIRLAIVSGETVIFRRDHAAPTRPSSWKAGDVVRYDLPSLFPLNSLDKKLDDLLDVYVGLLDVGKKRDGKFLPTGTSSRQMDFMRWVGSFGTPRQEGGLSKNDEDAVIARSKELLEAEDPRQAWDELEYALRKSDDYQQKVRLRKAIEALGHFAPREMTRIERGVVADRIRSEKIRYFRKWAGKMHDKKMYRGALKLLQEIGGSLEENNREAVVGALDEAKRVSQDAKSIKRRLLNAVIKADEGVIADLEKNLKEWRKRERLLDIADHLLKKGHKGAAWEALRRAKDDGDPAVREEALKRWKALEEEIIKGDGVTQAELDEIAKAKNHPVWARTIAMPSHRFIYIGPKAMIEGIIKLKQATRRFDLAYVFQTDHFGRSPNAGGSRITVYLKELWDFGGGQAGGNLIDIGRASPDKTKYRVDTGLMYHELVHCVYSFPLGYPGFNEGIANYGACFTFDVLGQASSQLHSLKRNLRDFEKDYASRDMAFWRIQKYGPSAGFFLHFINKYGKKGGNYDWQLYRLFFRGFNRTPVRDSRPRMAIRAIAYFLIKSFGDPVFDDLIKFRFPLQENDREALVKEMEAGDQKFPEFVKDRAGWNRHSNSPRLRDFFYRQLLAIRGRPFAMVKQYCQTRLGTIYDWKVCGPFLDPVTKRSFNEVFAPEQGEIDFAKRYEKMGKHTGVWRTPAIEDHSKYVAIDGDGWITIKYPYGDHTSSYCYSRLTATSETKAWIHLRTEDHFTVWLNGKLLHKMKNIGNPGSAAAAWRYRRVPDEFAVQVTLKPGPNYLMIKTTNATGKAGFIAAVVGANNLPIRDLKIDNEPPSKPTGGDTKPVRKIKWKKPITLTERQLGALKTVVGKFAYVSRNKKKKIRVGTDTRKRVGWRKYTVRPGFPKDSPSNLAYLPRALTKKLGAGDFLLEMTLQMKKKHQPKMTLTFDSEGGKDGLAGWTFIISPTKGHKAIAIRLEKYDNVFYTKQLKVKPALQHTIKLVRIDEKVTLTIDGEVALANIGTPNLKVKDSTYIGFATWNDSVGIEKIVFAKR